MSGNKKTYAETLQETKQLFDELGETLQESNQLFAKLAEKNLKKKAPEHGDCDLAPVKCYVESYNERQQKLANDMKIWQECKDMMVEIQDILSPIIKAAKTKN